MTEIWQTIQKLENLIKIPRFTLETTTQLSLKTDVFSTLDQYPEVFGL